jgi:hypothetical protein
MSQFNKYLEIVQEGKDYQYNEGLFSKIIERAKEIGENIKNQFSSDIYSKLKGKREILFFKEELKEIENTKEYKELSNLNPDSKIVYYFLKHGVIPIRYYSTSIGRYHIILSSTKQQIDPKELPEELKDIEVRKVNPIRYPHDVYDLFPSEVKRLVESISEEEITSRENREAMLRRNEENKMDLA